MNILVYHLNLFFHFTAVYLFQSRGLCGYYDWDKTNDFLTSNNIQEGSIPAFVDSFKPGSVCAATPEYVDACSQNSQYVSIKLQGPVAQSVVSLTSSLRVISLTVLADSIYNILIFFAEKM